MSTHSQGAALPNVKLNAVYSTPKMRRRYEVWFVRCGLADGSGAWWFRYLLVNNLKISPEASARRHFQLWVTCFLFGCAPQTFIVEMPLDQLDLSERGQVPFRCRSGESGIAEGRCWGNLRPDGHHISWNLGIDSSFGATLSDKGWIGFSRSPHSDAIFSGEIDFDGKKLSGEPLGFGVQGHNCGYRHRSYWRWMHAYFPPPDGGSTLEALVYDLPFGLVFRNAVWWHCGKASRVRKLKEMQIGRSSAHLQWIFSGQLDNGSPIEAQVDGVAPGVRELAYAKTNGSGTFPVSNASLAGATVKLGQTEVLETETGAVVEMGGA